MKYCNHNLVIAATPDQKSSGHHRIEPWYLTYTLLGATMGGIVPILGPLLILKRFGSPVYVGIVVAAFNLGGLAAPIWGKLADHFNIHRYLLQFGLLITSTALATFVLSHTIFVCLWLALIQGIGTSGVLTLGNLFIIEVHGQEEWDERLGWYQTFNCGGQVIGMLLASAMSHMVLEHSLLIAAGILATAVLPGMLTPPVFLPQPRSRPMLICPDGYTNRSHNFIKRICYQKIMTYLSWAKSAAKKEFTLFAVVWFLCLTGASIIYTLYPVMMPEIFGIGQKRLALAFAGAMGLSVILYPQSGHCAHRFGAANVLTFSIGARMCALIAFYLLVWSRFSGPTHLILYAFTAVVLCWPFIAVSGITLTAELSPQKEGIRMGIFNAVAALALTSGATIGGWFADNWGYHCACAMAVTTEMLGLILICRIRHTHGTLRRLMTNYLENNIKEEGNAE